MRTQPAMYIYIQSKRIVATQVKEEEEEEEGMAQGHQETRKGPWTVQEDKALACFVGLFGDRRWDFIAKVSGLNRAGKSCRLRWVNYLQPGLKRGKLSPQEERLVIELHSKCGNRWSRIAKKLPGRTDNEIKNYWRTHVRKKAQEMRKRDRVVSLSSSSYSLCDSSSTLSTVTTDPSMSPLTDLQSTKSDCDHKRGKNVNMEDIDGGSSDQPFVGGLQEDEKEEEACKAYSMDQIWKEIAPAETMSGVIPDENFRFDGGTNCPSPPMLAIASPLWDYQYEDQGWVFNIES